jgi:hypothetical protein
MSGSLNLCVNHLFQFYNVQKLYLYTVSKICKDKSQVTTNLEILVATYFRK